MVAIKDMDMPSCCAKCDFKEDYCFYCTKLHKSIPQSNFFDSRLPDCPLVEIEERKVGKWIVSKDSIYCPFCNTRQKIGTAEVELLSTVFTGFKFCKYCGAELRGSENENKNC